MKSASLLAGFKTVLRPPEETDLPFLHALRNDVELQMQLMAQPRANSLRRVRQWLDRISEDKQSVFFVVATKRQAPMGYIQLTHMEGVHGTADLGVCLARKAQGRGHGKEALVLLENYAATVFNIRKIGLKVLAGNVGAIALYQKSGYLKIGVQYQHFYQKKMFHDVVLMEKFLSAKDKAV